MKTFNLEVKGASQGQLIALKAELETMSKSWKKFGANIKVKRSRPSLAQEIKDMPMKDFRALWFVVQQGLKIKKANKLN